MEQQVSGEHLVELKEQDGESNHVAVCGAQVEELRSRQEAERKKQEESHGQKMEAVRQEYDNTIQGVCVCVR